MNTAPKDRGPSMDLRRIVSGGQTGVDRAALDAAIALGLPIGGWCPRGRRAEDGVIPAHYPLRETRARDYRIRTAWNVRDSDGTLILYRDELSGGTAYTVSTAKRLGRPCYLQRLGVAPSLDEWHTWIARNEVAVLNVAGPRESANPGIYREAVDSLAALLLTGTGQS